MAKGTTNPPNPPEISGNPPPRSSAPPGQAMPSRPPPSSALRGLVERLRRLVESSPDDRALRGVVGSIEQIGVPDLVQVLCRGRKTGALRITTPAEEGVVHFRDGAVVHAACGDLSGEEAFYTLARTTTGQFALDPDATSPEETITHTPEMLLLEAMRRLDESSAT